MKRNMSNTDRILRAIVAALFTYLYFSGIITGGLGILLLVLGAMFLLTSIFAFCPVYRLLKFSTHNL
jgi:hypothetical protein